MKGFLLVASIIIAVFFRTNQAKAQGNQTVVNGGQTTAVNFPAGSCTYNWVNNKPGIGLPASGTGNIAAFMAVNSGTTPINATITATPAPSGFAYIAGYSTGTVLIVDLSNNTIVKTIAVGTQPSRVAVSPDHSKVYVSNYGSDDISVISTSTNTVIATINIGAQPGGITVSPDNQTVYVTASNAKRLVVINAATNTPVTSIIVGSDPQGVLVTPDGTRVYVANTNSNTVSVINTGTNTVINTIPVGSYPIGIAMSPDGSRVYVANSNQGAVGTVSVINAATNKVIATITVGSNPYGIAVSPDGNTVYVTNNGWNTVSVINAISNGVTATITTPVAGSPTGVSVSSDGEWVYVENYVTGTVSVINASTNSVVNDISLNTQPISLGNFLISGTPCTGSPITFTITVKPSSVTPVITAGTATGTISACQGIASASPNIEQFTVFGTGLTNDITATAPTGFEISLSASGVYGNTVTIPETGAAANNTVVYVRSAASATGTISGNVVLTSSGATTQTVAVTGQINPLPTVNPVGNQTVIAGNNITAINFTGTANSFTWTSSNPTIGLTANGTGNIPTFTAVNKGTSPLTAVVTVTPTNKQVYAYIPNASTATVSVVDLATNQTIGTIPVGLSPIGVSVSPDGTKVYVTNQRSSSVSVIDAATNTLQTTITLAAGTNPTGVVVSPDGSKVYVTNHQTNTVSILNAATNTLISTITVGTSPYGISVSADGKWVYVANSADNTISVINTATNIVIATIPVGMAPNDMCISMDGSTLYVANYGTNNVSVINTLNNSVTMTIATGAGASVATLSPDGKVLYVSNINDNTVSVINTTNNSLIATISAGITPLGLSVSKDGSKLYVANLGSKTITIVNTLTNTVINTINVGLSPYAVGNFISETTGCDGPPTTFTITVNPTPTITASAVAGNISACEGSASASPDIEQFTVSGNSLINDIVATAPSGFEVSLSPATGYGNSVTITQSGGKVNNVTVYVHSAASATGNISGNVTLTSQSATTQNVPVTGKINPLPTVNPVGKQVVVSGMHTTGVIFTGTASTYNWVNDNPAIGIAYGTSTNIVPFIATNTGNTPIIGTFTVTPINTATGCNGKPITFTIEVDPILPADITATGTLSSLSTIYGTASSSTSFNVSGTSMNAGILITPPAGFEVSTDNTNFSQTATVGAPGTIAATTVYIRLTSKTPVSSYLGYITLSSAGATDAGVPVPISVVNAAPLTITANNVQKRSGQTLTSGIVSTGFTSSGLQNNETIGSVFITYGDGAEAAAKVGTYAGSAVPSGASGGSFDPKNYTITYQAGDIIVTESTIDEPIAIPNAFTPNGDGINDVWNIKSLIDYPSCLVSIFTRYGSMIYQSRGYAKPWDGVYNGSVLPTGTYYYIIDLQNGQPPLSGYVALIR